MSREGGRRVFAGAGRLGIVEKYQTRKGPKCLSWPQRATMAGGGCQWAGLSRLEAHAAFAGLEPARARFAPRYTNAEAPSLFAGRRRGCSAELAERGVDRGTAEPC